jgi:hypothetical protein
MALNSYHNVNMRFGISAILQATTFSLEFYVAVFFILIIGFMLVVIGYVLWKRSQERKLQELSRYKLTPRKPPKKKGHKVRRGTKKKKGKEATDPIDEPPKRKGPRKTKLKDENIFEWDEEIESDGE